MTIVTRSFRTSLICIALGSVLFASCAEEVALTKTIDGVRVTLRTASDDSGCAQAFAKYGILTNGAEPPKATLADCIRVNFTPKSVSAIQKFDLTLAALRALDAYKPVQMSRGTNQRATDAYFKAPQSPNIEPPDYITVAVDCRLMTKERAICRN